MKPDTGFFWDCVEKSYNKIEVWRGSVQSIDEDARRRKNTVQ